MAIQDGQDSVQNRVVEEQPKDSDQNIDPILLAWPPRSAHKTVGLRRSKCGSSRHTVKVCSS